MRTKLFIILTVVFGLLASVVVLAQDSSPAEPEVLTSSVHRFADGSEVEGAFARLVRYDNGATLALSTNDLVPGEVYTVWWVIFNEPENCTGGVCDADDIFVIENGEIPRDADNNRVMNVDTLVASNVSIQHATGSYTPDGELNVSASLGEGMLPGVIFGPGLVDINQAEIHIVVRTHGPKDDATYADQLSTFGGGCEPMDNLPCDDIQFAVFLAPGS